MSVFFCPSVDFLFVVVVHVVVSVGFMYVFQVVCKEGCVLCVACGLVSCCRVSEGYLLSVLLVCSDGLVEGLPERFAFPWVHTGYFSL